MEMTITTSSGRKALCSCAETEASVYEAIGFWFSKQTQFPLQFEVACEYGNATYSFDVRHIENEGSTDPNDMHLRELSSNLYFPAGPTPPEKYLTCVEPNTNRYKFYRMKPETYGIDVEFGRMGGRISRVRNPYASRWYWLLLAEKKLKGYVDNSEVYLDEEVEAKTTEDKPVANDNSDSAFLFNLLYDFAKNRVRRALLNQRVTLEQAKKCRELLGELAVANTLTQFNQVLLALMAICPRRIDGFKEDGVASLLAKDVNDFKKIYDREESLVMAIEAVAGTSKKKTSKSGFDALNIEVFKATDEQKAEVLSHLGDGLKTKVKEVYRVIHPAHKERFESYLKRENISVVKQFWHGSKNENWLSIIENGLLLNPDAQITGKMFGHGIYFAPSARKSFGYTSTYGSYWARGNSDLGIMGLYACAYGTPVDAMQINHYSKSSIKAAGGNCLHAYASSNFLLNDEVVFYDEAAMLLNYIVIFDA